MTQLGLPLTWFILRPLSYDGLPGEGYLVQAWDKDDAVREFDLLGMGPVESCEPDRSMDQD